MKNKEKKTEEKKIFAYLEKISSPINTEEKGLFLWKSLLIKYRN